MDLEIMVRAVVTGAVTTSQTQPATARKAVRQKRGDRE